MRPWRCHGETRPQPVAAEADPGRAVRRHGDMAVRHVHEPDADPVGRHAELRARLFLRQLHDGVDPPEIREDGRRSLIADRGTLPYPFPVKDVLEAALRAEESGIPAALVTVIATEGSTP